MANKQKGGEFERDFCRLLSTWWDPSRDDIFWRSSTSGGRATTRMKKGKRTFGHHGDIAATDPIGFPLTQVCTWELKRGYTKETAFGEAMDATPVLKQCLWEGFVEQAETAATGAGTFAWVLVQRRDKRRVILWFPRRLYTELSKVGAFRGMKTVTPWLVSRLWIKVSDERKAVRRTICGILLDDFFMKVRPKHFKKLNLKLKIGKR